MASTNIISTDTDGITVPKWQFMWNYVLSYRFTVLLDVWPLKETKPACIYCRRKVSH